MPCVHIFYEIFNPRLTCYVSHVPSQHPAPAPKPLAPPPAPPTSQEAGSSSSAAPQGSGGPPASIGPLQLARINQLYDMILPGHQGGGGALGGRGQVDLEGQAPTADLNLFKEAIRATQEMLVHVTIT